MQTFSHSRDQTPFPQQQLGLHLELLRDRDFVKDILGSVGRFLMRTLVQLPMVAGQTLLKSGQVRHQ